MHHCPDLTLDTPLSLVLQPGGGGCAETTEQVSPIPAACGSPASRFCALPAALSLFSPHSKAPARGPKARLSLAPSDQISTLLRCPCSLHLATLVSLMLWNFPEPSAGICKAHLLTSCKSLLRYLRSVRPTLTPAPAPCPHSACFGARSLWRIPHLLYPHLCGAFPAAAGSAGAGPALLCRLAPRCIPPALRTDWNAGAGGD